MISLITIGAQFTRADGYTNAVTANDGTNKDGAVIKRIYTAEELKQQAEAKKTALLAEAESVIALLERTIRLNMAEGNESERLAAWERYSVMLSRVDTAARDSSTKWSVLTLSRAMSSRISKRNISLPRESSAPVSLSKRPSEA